jgi:flagellar biosynthetic protein FlhB
MAESDQDDKTEAPSQKRIDDARAKGDVPRSAELNNWFILSGFTLMLVIYGSSVSSMPPLKAFFAQASGFTASHEALKNLSSEMLLSFARYLLLPFALAFSAAMIGPLLQHMPTPSLENAMPKWSRLSPLEGFKRVFGAAAFAQFIKNLAKLAVVGILVGFALWDERHQLIQMVDLPVAALLDAAREALLHILISVVAVYALVAGGDYLYQWFSWWNRLRMSRQDLKDEYKQQEGSPEVKNRLRTLRRKFAKSVMMANVKKATVVVANPTHFAVALRYEEGMRAPVCVAKGVDVLALKIRKLAEENEVPVVEDRPLARSLYKLVEVDAEIPLDLYKPVAEIIGYVMKLRIRRQARIASR